jgi:hypothetical protein
MPAARLDESLSFEPSASRPNLLPPYPGRLTFGSPPAANSSECREAVVSLQFQVFFVRFVVVRAPSCDQTARYQRQ